MVVARLAMNPSALPFARIHLIGPRGGGKTTGGRLLAERLGWTFADTDERIERAAGLSIAELFATRGENSFRELEAEVLSAFGAAERIVVATGGGVVLRPENRELLRTMGRTIWLTAPAEVLWQRI